VTRNPSSSAAWRNWALGTISFALCFAAWGMIAAFGPAFGPAFRTEFALDDRASALLVAVPVLLGSVARIPLGMLTDRLGGRLTFTLLFLAVAAAAAIVPRARSFDQLLLFAFFLGLAGSSFAVGVGFVSRWFPPEKQGMALGVYGMGNVGQSLALYFGPAMGAMFGREALPGMLTSLVLFLLCFFVYRLIVRSDRAPEQEEEPHGLGPWNLHQTRVARTSGDTWAHYPNQGPVDEFDLRGQERVRRARRRSGSRSLQETNPRTASSSRTMSLCSLPFFLTTG
jgi:nitrate/nitrite transporter NarK